MVQPTESPRNQLQRELIEKCWKDPDFRRRVVADPKGMFESATGKTLPDGLTIFVHEEDANTLHLSLPPKPEHPQELSDDELERVAGGTEIVSITIIAFTGVVVTASAAASAVAAGGGKNPW